VSAAAAEVRDSLSSGLCEREYHEWLKADPERFMAHTQPLDNGIRFQPGIAGTPDLTLGNCSKCASTLAVECP